MHEHDNCDKERTESTESEPRTGHPDHRHQLGTLLGATTRGDVLELHGTDGSVTVRVPRAKAQALAMVADDLTEPETEPEVRADGGQDRLYYCPRCTTVTTADVAECPACGHDGERKTLAFVGGDDK